MALYDEWVQQLLRYEVTLEPPADFEGSDSGAINRHAIDGTLIVYDPDDMPKWLQELEAKKDDDGNVERQVA